MSTTEAVRIHADHANSKHLGHWTTATTFEVKARSGAAVLDLRSPEIPEGDIEIRLNLHRAMVKLLVPDDVVIETWDLQWVNRGQVKDGAAPKDAAGRRIRLVGTINNGEVRVHRGGMAIWSAMFTKEFIQDCRDANKEGRVPTLIDPTGTMPFKKK